MFIRPSFDFYVVIFSPLASLIPAIPLQEANDLSRVEFGRRAQHGVARHAIGPRHVAPHALDDRRPFLRGVALRVGQHVALRAGDAEYAARRRMNVGVFPDV